jgi:prepilin-type processing-associated H-X9-DG protein
LRPDKQKSDQCSAAADQHITNWWGNHRSIRASPSTVALLGDARTISLPTDYTGKLISAASPFYGMALRHGNGSFNDEQGRAVFLLFDGHVESRSYAKICPNFSQVSIGLVIHDAIASSYLTQQGICWKGGGFESGFPIGQPYEQQTWQAGFVIPDSY